MSDEQTMEFSKISQKELLSVPVGTMHLKLVNCKQNERGECLFEYYSINVFALFFFLIYLLFPSDPFNLTPRFQSMERDEESNRWRKCHLRYANSKHEHSNLEDRQKLKGKVCNKWVI